MPATQAAHSTKRLCCVWACRLLHGAWDERDETVSGNRKKKQKEIIALMFGAGEMFERSFVGQFVELEFCLKVACRDAIRKHLLDLNSHEHLFNRIPRLGLPHSLSDSLADLRGGARDARPPPGGPNSFIFMQFLAKI